MWLCWPRIHGVEKGSVVVSLTRKCVYTDTFRIQRVRVAFIAFTHWNVVDERSFRWNLSHSWFVITKVVVEKKMYTEMQASSTELKVNCAKMTGRWKRNHVQKLAFPTSHLNWNASFLPCVSHAEVLRDTQLAVYRWSCQKLGVEVNLWVCQLWASVAVAFIYFILEVPSQKYLKDGWLNHQRLTANWRYPKTMQEYGV